MSTLDEMQFITPTITKTLDGNYKNDEGELLKIKRKDVRNDARSLAKDSNFVQNYLNGNVGLQGNDSRQRLFERTFNRELDKERKQQELQQLMQNASNLTGDDAVTLAKGLKDLPRSNYSWTTHNFGDRDLLRIAPAGIGYSLALSNPVTRAAVEELGPAVKHGLKVMWNPASAETAFGEALATTADVAGAGYSVKDNADLLNKWANGSFNWSDIPQFGLNALGSLPGMKFAIDLFPAVSKAVKWKMDDTVNAYRAMMSGEEPVLGIRADALSEEFLPDPPSEIQLDVPMTREVPTISQSGIELPLAPRPEQYSSLSQDVVAELNRHGLGRYDIQNLLDRGLTTEDMLRLTDTYTPGSTGNYRAQILEQRLRDMGVTPSLPTRLDYLQSFVDNGGVLMQYRNRPYSFEEWTELPETRNLDPFEHEWQGGMPWIRDVYYGAPRPTTSGTTPRSITSRPVQQTPSEIFSRNFSNLQNTLAKNIAVFGDQWPSVQPKIQQILETGISTGKSESQIEQELRALYASYDKPFDIGPTTFGRYGAYAESNWGFQPRPLFDASAEYVGNSAIRATPYKKISEIPHLVTPADKTGSPNHFVVIDPSTRSLASMYSDIDNNMLHGGITYEVNKSAQSSPMAHKRYAKLAKQGKGITTFLPRSMSYNLGKSRMLPDDGYFYAVTNGLEGSRVSPRQDNLMTTSPFGLNNPTAAERIDKNIAAFEDILNSTQQKVFDDMGGLPKYGIEIGDKQFIMPIVRQDMPDGTSKLIMQRSDDFNNAITKYDDDVEKIVKYQKTLDKYISDANNILAEKGYRAFLTDDGRAVAMAPDGKVVPLTTIFNEFPELEQLRNFYRGSLININSAAARLGEVNFHQPVGVFRYRKHGGKITDNLNSTVKRLLNV